MTKFIPRLWFAPRFYWALGTIAFLLACSPGVPAFVWVAGVAASALATATVLDAFLGPRRNTVTVKRVVPPHFALAIPATIAYELENASAVALRCAVVELPTRTLQPAERTPFLRVPPRTVARIETAATPVARGTGAFTALILWYDNALGLIRRRVRISSAQEFRVYPDLSAVERYGALHVRNRLLEAGLRRLRLRGGGTEFESLREFAAGDAFRAVDWKATARRGKLMVAQHEIERSQDLMLAIDCGRLMTARLGDRRKLDYAVTAALSLASIASLAHDRVGITAFAADMLVARAPRSTAASINALTNAVCDLEPRFEESDYARAASYLRSHLHRRSLIVLFTDVIDPVAQSTVLAELASLAKRHVVLCVFMNDRAVARALSSTPERIEQAYELDVAIGLAQERAQASSVLTRTGITVLDVPASQLAVATIDEYLRIKQRGLL